MNITINKVANDTLPEGLSRNFYFNVYLDEDCEDVPLNGNTPVSITITDTETQGTKIVKINDLTWSDFYETRKVTLYVKEEKGNSKFWSYDESIQPVVVTPDDLTGEVTFYNTYTPREPLVLLKDGV